MAQGVSGSTSVAANASSGNVLSGKVLEVITKPSRVRVYAAASAVGLVGTFYSGADIVQEESAVSQANRFPLKPDDEFAQDVAAPNDRLQLNFRNTTGAAITVYWKVEADPV